MDLDAFRLTYLFDLFTCILYVRNHNCDVPVAVIVVAVVVAWTVVVLLTGMVVS